MIFRIDLILLSGDNADMAMDREALPDTVQKYEEDMRQVVQALEAIHPIVIYIPGNVLNQWKNIYLKLP